MTTARVTTPTPTTQSSPSTSTSSPSGGRVQLKQKLGGLDFAAGSAMLAPRDVQAKGDVQQSSDVHAHAEAGTKGGGGSLPHLDAIQQSFGGHDVSSVQAYQGGDAAAACEGMGAEAYASGNKVAFAGGADLHTAAHEAAHVVQQRAGVQLSGGVGQVGDSYEQHADKVADAVVQGKSAESLLGPVGGGGGGADVQQQAVQRDGASGGGAGGGGGGGYVKPEVNEDGGHNKWTPGVTDYKPIDVKGTKPEDTLTTPQYKTFAKRIKTLLDGIGSTADPEQIAQSIWLTTMQGMNATQQAYEDAPLVEGSTYEKKMSDKAYQDLLPKFDGIASQINSAFAGANIQDAKSWGFWSGEGAKDAAVANCQASLEGGYIGYAFDAINIGGGWDIQLWGALSKAYAEAAVAKVEGREFHIFVGSGKNGTEAITTENIWAQVESKVVYAKAKRTPGFQMTVHAVKHPKSKVPDAGLTNCVWSSGPVPPVSIEPMRNIARSKANDTFPKASPT